MQWLVSTAATKHGEAYGLILVGIFLLAGFAAHVLGRRVHIPRVTVLLLMGFLVNPSALDLIPEEVSNWFPLSAKIALSIIGFQLGEQFLGKELRKTGKVVFSISITVGTTVVFELVGPLVTRYTLRHAGEIPATRSPDSKDAQR